jgi:hypothetical protein
MRLVTKSSYDRPDARAMTGPSRTKLFVYLVDRIGRGRRTQLEVREAIALGFHDRAVADDGDRDTREMAWTELRTNVVVDRVGSNWRAERETEGDDEEPHDAAILVRRRPEGVEHDSDDHLVFQVGGHVEIQQGDPEVRHDPRERLDVEPYRERMDLRTVAVCDLADGAAQRSHEKRDQPLFERAAARRLQLTRQILVGEEPTLEALDQPGNLRVTADLVEE